MKNQLSQCFKEVLPVAGRVVALGMLAKSTLPLLKHDREDIADLYLKRKEYTSLEEKALSYAHPSALTVVNCLNTTLTSSPMNTTSIEGSRGRPASKVVTKWWREGKSLLVVCDPGALGKKEVVIKVPSFSNLSFIKVDRTNLTITSQEKDYFHELVVSLGGKSDNVVLDNIAVNGNLRVSMPALGDENRVSGKNVQVDALTAYGMGGGKVSLKLKSQQQTSLKYKCLGLPTDPPYGASPTEVHLTDPQGSVFIDLCSKVETHYVDPVGVGLAFTRIKERIKYGLLKVALSL